MLKSLVESKCINIERLLVLSAKELKIDGNECHILLLIYTLMEAGIKTVTPQMIQNYSMLTSHIADGWNLFPFNIIHLDLVLF